jgi:DNA-binding transcriptional MerR regulator
VTAGRLAIGAFARVTRLTVKALRHYDAEGLLPPAEVDPGTEYRYYTLDQVPVATTIALLRSLDVPLPRIREFLAAGPDAARAELLAVERERLAAEVTRATRALATVERLMTRPTAARYEVRVEDRRSLALDALVATTRTDDIGPATAAACGRLAGVLAGDAAVTTPFVAVFPLDLDDTLKLAVGVPAGAAGRRPGLTEVRLPSGPWAATLHVGAYDAVPLAYAALLDRVRELGHEPAGPMTETYLADPATVAEHEQVTAVAVALGPS